MNARTLRRRASLTALALALSLGACGDDAPPGTNPCGDGFCLGSENQNTCPRDCPYECQPGAQRCAGNTVLTCRLDGLSESAQLCQPDEVCTESGCEPSPGLTPDLGDDPDLGDAEDLMTDLDAGDDADLPADAADDGPPDSGD